MVTQHQFSQVLKDHAKLLTIHNATPFFSACFKMPFDFCAFRLLQGHDLTFLSLVPTAKVSGSVSWAIN